MLAWPFGICNEELIMRASAAGYIAAFTMERRHASSGDNIMMLPRYLMANGNSGKVLETIQEGASR